jgi:hypothetical protein
MIPSIPRVISAVGYEGPPLVKERAYSPSWLYRALVFLLKFAWGMLFCQSIVGSILVIGWSYRLAQRSVLKYWWSRSGRRQQGETLAEFLASDEQTKPHCHWPNWFFRQNLRGAIRRQRGRGTAPYVLSLLQAPWHSLWLNFWVGVRAILNTWVLTLPAGLFWWFGWYDGWNNSFNKGYEQAAVGPLISLVGIALFIVVMFYLPLAQARQAATGEWRSFYQFRLVRLIIRQRWVSCLGLALLYSLCALPLNVLKTFPMFSPVSNPGLEGFSDAEALHLLRRLFFWSAVWLLPAYVMLRLVAARLYASGLLALVQTGKVLLTDLAENERTALARLALATVQPPPARPAFVRFIAWSGTRAGRVAAGTALAWIWFTFAAQIYIAEFLNYHAALGWINQPLVQLPWFHYVPARLKNPGEEIVWTLVVFLIALLIGSVMKTVRMARAHRHPSSSDGMQKDFE